MGKQAAGTKIILLIILSILMVLISFIAQASELRVQQLGSEWLVPDEYVDALVNPAMINFIGENILVGKLYNDFSSMYSSSWDDHLMWAPGLKAAFMGDLGLLKAGIAYNPSVAIETINGLYSSGGFHNDVSLTMGMKLNDNISFGLSPNAGVVLDYVYGSAALFSGGLSAGFNYRMDSVDLGVVLHGDTVFSGAKNYSAFGNIIGGIKISGRSELRFYDKISSSSSAYGLNQLIPANPFGGLFFGKYGVNNMTGISYSGSFSGVNYVIGLNNTWNIYTYSNYGMVDTGYTYRNETTSRGDSLNLRLGFEIKLFADWLNLRGSFNPLQYSYNDDYGYDETNSAGEFLRTKTNSLGVLPSSGLIVGIGIDLSENMKLDLIYGGLIGYYDENQYRSTSNPPGYKYASGGNSVSAEFTMKW